MAVIQFVIGELYYSTNTEYGPFVGRYAGTDDKGWHQFIDSANKKTSALIGKYFFTADKKQIEKYY